MLSLCTKDGSIQQAKNAVATLASLYESDPEKKIEVFTPLLDTMTSSSRLTLSSGGKPNTKIINVLDTLTAMVEKVPAIFSITSGKKDRGAKAIRFALETILLGRGDKVSISQQDSDSSSEDENDDTSKTSSPRRQSKSKKRVGRKSAGIDDTISFACKRACAAITFLVAHIRSTILVSKFNTGKDMKTGGQKSIFPPKGHITAIFELLISILEDDGLPPSSNDRHDCKSVEDRVELRKVATINIMRLCDKNLDLEKSFLTTSMWHVLGRSFVDKDKIVRGKCDFSALCFLLPRYNSQLSSSILFKLQSPRWTNSLKC